VLLLHVVGILLGLGGGGSGCARGERALVTRATGVTRRPRPIGPWSICQFLSAAEVRGAPNRGATRRRGLDLGGEGRWLVRRGLGLGGAAGGGGLVGGGGGGGFLDWNWRPALGWELGPGTSGEE
jgi:hypothetical protein